MNQIFFFRFKLLKGGNRNQHLNKIKKKVGGGKFLRFFFHNLFAEN